MKHCIYRTTITKVGDPLRTFSLVITHTVYTSSVNCIKFTIVYYTSGKTSVGKLCLDKKLLKFKT